MNGILKLVEPKSVNLDKISTESTGGLTKEESKAEFEKLGEELNELEDWHFAARTHSILILLQGRDTSGKDGTIRAILKHMNAITVRVNSFGTPTERELAHDFLWRVHMHTPPKGGFVFFNRSHYEDVLVVRAKKLAPESVWRPRFEMINHFEDMLVQNNTILLKFFLHISKDEQKKRLLEREMESEKAWKLNTEDWAQRKVWGAFTQAYNEVFEQCSPDRAPWHIVSSDHKWCRNLAIMRTLVETLRPYKAGWMKHMEKMGKQRKEELARYRAENQME